jgi:hypothetical protein
MCRERPSCVGPMETLFACTQNGLAAPVEGTHTFSPYCITCVAGGQLRFVQTAQPERNRKGGNLHFLGNQQL